MEREIMAITADSTIANCLVKGFASITKEGEIQRAEKQKHAARWYDDMVKAGTQLEKYGEMYKST